MKKRLLSRRKFIGLSLFLSAGAVAGEAKLLEPTWLKIRRLKIGSGPTTHRIAQFSDVHHKGDRAYLAAVVQSINALRPDFVCFTGDLIEIEPHAVEALELLAAIKAPLYGVPGNHDYWSQASFIAFRETFAKSGGAWLMDEAVTTADGKFRIIGPTCKQAASELPALDPTRKNLLLAHYPAWVKKLGDQQFDLMLVGHSHGGQVRLPFLGAVMLPYAVEEYDLGLFQTKNGPLYVNPGIGYIYDYKVRLNCRPEITLFEI